MHSDQLKQKAHDFDKKFEKKVILKVHLLLPTYKTILISMEIKHPFLLTDSLFTECPDIEFCRDNSYQQILYKQNAHRQNDIDRMPNRQNA